MNPMDWHIGSQIYFGGVAIGFLAAVIVIIRSEETEYDSAAALCFFAPWFWPLAAFFGTVIGIPMGFGWLITHRARAAKKEREARSEAVSDDTKKHLYNNHGV